MKTTQDICKRAEKIVCDIRKPLEDAISNTKNELKNIIINKLAAEKNYANAKLKLMAFQNEKHGSNIGASRSSQRHKKMTAKMAQHCKNIIPDKEKTLLNAVTETENLVNEYNIKEKEKNIY